MSALDRLWVMLDPQDPEERAAVVSLAQLSEDTLSLLAQMLVRALEDAGDNDPHW